jgi:transposase
MAYSVAERVAIVEAYINTGSIKEIREIFGSKFPGKSLPAKIAIQALVKKWRATGSVANAPKRRRPSVRTPEVTDDIRRRIMQSRSRLT